MNEHDLVVIGAGPGGYVAAIRAAQLGLNTAIVEKVSELGGTCLRVGCIPSKALLDSSEKFAAIKHDYVKIGIKAAPELDLPTMLKNKDSVVKSLTGGIGHLMKKNKIKRYEGHGRLDGPGKVIVEGKDKAEIKAKHIILATGSYPSTFPSMAFDGDLVGSSTEALSYPEVPKHLVVIGAGVIGLELGSVWSRLGSKVTVLEYMDHILPGMDRELSSEALKTFKKQGLEFHLSTKVTSAKAKGKGCVVEAEGMEPIKCDRVLVAIGRKPYTENLGLDSVGIKTDKIGRIEVSAHYKTAAEGVYAIGDVIEGPMLAHKAEDEGMACVERIVTGYSHVNYNAIPGIVYTDPEIATVGKTEEQLKEEGTPYRKGSFPYMANGRAKAISATEGWVKILAHEKTDRILGAHMIGKHAGDLIAEVAVGIEFGASSEDIARACHAHPTLAEVVKEAAMAVDKRTIHF